MSSKFDSFEPDLATSLQREPSEAHAAPDGPANAAAPAAPASAPVASDAAPSANVAPSSAAPAPLGAPEPEEPLTWCRKCARNVLPISRGKCPHCGVFLQQNFAARRHPVNKARVDQIYEELVDEYKPITLIAKTNCRHLATVYEALEKLKPGGIDYTRLVTLSQALGAQLETSHPRAAPDPEREVAEVRRTIIRTGNDAPIRSGSDNRNADGETDPPRC